MVRRFLALLAVCAALGGAHRAPAQSAEEHEVKAAFLYNFVKFVEWPGEVFPASDSPLILCVLGEAGFRHTLSAMVEGRQIRNHQITVQEVTHVGDAADCHVLFLSRSEDRHLPEILETVCGTHVLTVGEASGFVARGGMIGFLIEGSKVRFEINNDAAEQCGLQISSQLLKLARSVIPPPVVAR